MIGVDLLGVARYQDTALRAFEKIGPSYSLGCFAKFPDGFGDPLPLVEKLAIRGLCKVFRIHGSWDDGHKPEKYFKRTLIEARRYDALALRFLDCSFYFDSGCEHRNTPKHAQLQKKLMQECPHLLISNNHDDPEFLPKRVNEIHGRRPRKPKTPYIVSPDGDSMDGFPWREYNDRFRDATIRYWWSWACNGRRNAADKTPRSKRKHWPSVDDIVQGAKLVKV